MNIDKIIRIILFKFVRIYQILISPYFVGRCKFYPTCSDYGKDAIKKYNSFSALFLIIRRIILCHPWSIGGYKTIPNLFSIKRYLIFRLFAVKNKFILIKKL